MTKRIPVIAGNWKMHKASAEGADFVRALIGRLGPIEEREVVVAPPFTGLAEAVNAARTSVIQVAAQDVFWEDQGPYTGEVAPGMLAALGVRWVIIGHSERRQLFGEGDDGVARKVRAALNHDLTPIMCVGESEAEREAGLTEWRLDGQVVRGLSRVEPAEAARLTIAYEPIWAIGTGRTATPETAQEACRYIRRRLRDVVGLEAAEDMRILYGGSVRPDNIDELMAQSDIDGALVGGASLDIEAFARIVGFEAPR